MVLEYRVNMVNAGGGPGLSVFHGRGQTGAPVGLSSQDLADKVRVMFDSIKALFLPATVWSFPAEVLDLDTATGVLTAVHAITAPANVVGTGTGAIAAPAGAAATWLTPAIVAGRRLKGRTFFVPLTVSQYESNGTLLAGAVTTLGNAAAAYRNTSVFTNVAPSVWSRTHGVQADITAHLIPDRVSVLRSRRD